MCMREHLCQTNLTPRSRLHPDGLPRGQLTAKQKRDLHWGNQITKAAFCIATEAHACGVPVTIENPKSSLMWHCSAFKKWQRFTQPTRVDFDMCMYGTPHKKPTTLVVVGDVDLASLGQRCMS